MRTGDVEGDGESLEGQRNDFLRDMEELTRGGAGEGGRGEGGRGKRDKDRGGRGRAEGRPARPRGTREAF